MSDLQKKIDEATTQMLAKQRERDEAEKSANAHEAAARADRLRMSELKKELAELNTALRHTAVQKQVDDAASLTRTALAEAEKTKAAAEASKSEAEATLARLAEKEKEIDAMLAKAKEATAE